MDFSNNELFVMQADKVCQEIFSQISDRLYIKTEIKSFQNEMISESISAFNSIIARDNLLEELSDSEYKFKISDAFYDETNICFFVIYFNDSNKCYQKYVDFFSCLVESIFQYFIKEWKDSNCYFYNNSINSIILRNAMDGVIMQISKKCSGSDEFSLYENTNLSLMNVLSDLSSITYEKNNTEGLIYFTDSPQNAEFQFEFDNYEEYGNFSQNNLKLLRKLLELTNVKNGIGIISDTNKIFGIGTIKSKCQYYSVYFENDRKWTVFQNENEILSIKNNNLAFINSFISKKEFISYASKIYPEIAENKDSDNFSNMYSIIKSIVKQKKGSILVFMKNASEHIKKYQDLSILIKPVKLDEKNVEKLSSIDGAVFIDENCICYGFGVVLDGLDTGSGNRARGSRYNSCERFFNYYKNEEETGLFIFILSDDGNYNIFPKL